MSRLVPGPAWLGSLAAVLVLHAGVIAVALWRPGGQAMPAAPVALDAVMVELAPAPEAPQVADLDAAIGPAQQRQRQAAADGAASPGPPVQAPEVVEPPADPVPVSRPDPPVVTETPAPDRPEAESAEDTEDAEAVAETTAPAHVDAEPSTRFAAQRTSVGEQADAAEAWQAVLLGHLERFRRYPRHAERLHQQGVVYVRFDVDRRGHVSAARIDQGSGHRLLDEETLAVVARADPVPPPPDTVPGDPVSVRVPVSFFLSRR